jgi:hypothetical protein
MKKITYLFTTTIILSSFLFVSCSDDDDTDEVITSSILGDWTVSSVTAPSDATAQDWSNMTISITGSDAGGTLTSSGGPDCGVPVMPETTPWIYTDDTNTMISRDDDVNMSISGLTDNAMTLSFNVDYDFPALDPTKGFLESFTYSDDTNVREDITYPEGIINEWPQTDANDTISGGNVSISGGKLVWEYTRVLEAAIGWEFENGIDISENPTLSFEYQLPLGTIFSVYMFGGDGEGQLFAPDDYNLILGADVMNEVSINLSNSSVVTTADPNTTSMEAFYGFYMIVGLTDPDPNSATYGQLLPDAEGSLLYFDNINVGGVSLCTEASVSGDWTFSLTK